MRILSELNFFKTFFFKGKIPFVQQGFQDITSQPEWIRELVFYLCSIPILCNAVRVTSLLKFCNIPPSLNGPSTWEQNCERCTPPNSLIPSLATLLHVLHMPVVTLYFQLQFSLKRQLLSQLFSIQFSKISLNIQHALNTER